MRKRRFRQKICQPTKDSLRGVPTHLASKAAGRSLGSTRGLGYLGHIRDHWRVFRQRYQPALPIVVATIFAIWCSWEVSPHSGGPGITCDELYHVYHAKRLWHAISTQGIAFFQPERIRENFPYGGRESLPFHPPFAYYVLGAVHALVDPFPTVPAAVSIVSARLAGALVLWCLITGVGLWVARREGPVAGVVAAWACGAMPRLFGHAHLAGLDLLTAATSVAAILAAIDVRPDQGTTLTPGSFTVRKLLWAGLWLGLAMLTRLHGMLLAGPIFLWLLIAGGPRGLIHALACIGVALGVFFLGWPWLWLDPASNVGEFLRLSAQRLPLNVYYLGTVWKDVDVPWHYPFVIAAATIPAGLLVLGALGLIARVAGNFRNNSANQGKTWNAIVRLLTSYEGMVLLQLLFWLGLFAWPRIPVYDGERLFLTIYPLWAITVAWGVKFVWENRLALGQWQFYAAAVPLILAASSVYGHFVYRPVYLSFYNAFVGGIAGAARLGLEVNYWGDAITYDVVTAACRHEQTLPVAGEEPRCILFGPNLAPFQAGGVNVAFDPLELCGAFIVGWESSWTIPPRPARVAILYHRRADLGNLPQWMIDSPVVYERSLRGIWLARVVLLPEWPDGTTPNGNSPLPAGP